VTIILKSTSPSGWKSATGLLDRGHAVMCPACGAICDESGTREHDAWHQAMKHTMLPSITDFLTEMAGFDDELPAEPERSTKDYVDLPKLTAADVER
jgi:hypothetical protein